MSIKVTKYPGICNNWSIIVKYAWNITIEKGINVLDYAGKTKNCGWIENGWSSGRIVLNVELVCESNELYSGQEIPKRTLGNNKMIAMIDKVMKLLSGAHIVIKEITMC